MARLPLKTTLLLEDAAGVKQVTRSRKVTINIPGKDNWKRTNLQLASLACGLALATVVAIGASQLLRDNGNTGTSAPGARVVSQPTGSTFGSLGIESDQAHMVTNAAGIPGFEEALGNTAQPAEATLVDPTDFGSLGVAHTLSQSEATQFGSMVDAVYASQGIEAQSQFGSMADADYSAIGLAYVQSASVPEAIDGRDGALGLGQPAEGAQSESPIFGTMADADFAANRQVSSDDGSVSHIVDGVYVGPEIPVQ
jgi:hypothetical protein